MISLSSTTKGGLFIKLYNSKGKRFEYEQEVDEVTGEVKEFAKIEVDNDTELSVGSHEARLRQIEFMKKLEYREKGRRKKHFAQTMPAYEETVIGKYPSKLLDCLMRTLPYMNYNGDNQVNANDVIKISGKIANDTSLSKLWGVSRPTAVKYIDRFVEDNIWETKKIEGFNGNAYRFKQDVFLKGSKSDKEYLSKKVVLETLGTMITHADQERSRILSKPFTHEEKRYAKGLSTFHPIACLGALLTKTHYKSFFLVNNQFDDEIVKEDETVQNVLNSSYKKRRFKFLKKYEMWNLYSRTETKKLSSDRKLELEACVYVLKRIGALGKWETGKNEYYLMNPSLVFASPNAKCDDEWYQFICTMFNLKNLE
jgi:hypothetical protein